MPPNIIKNESLPATPMSENNDCCNLTWEKLEAKLRELEKENQAMRQLLAVLMK
jgi:hypothetical protein